MRKQPLFDFTNPPHAIFVSPREAAPAERNFMNPANLPFDSETMLQGLRGWVECESPTWDAIAVERMLDLAARDMAIMGATIERIAGRQGFGGCVRARFPHPRQGEPGILIAGHLDTVHPVGTLEKLPWRREGNKCYGPGIFDMKGGNYLTLEAIGKPSHAGATLSSGRSAIREMARQIIAIDGMTSEDCTFSVGIVHGGLWVNCVATTCSGERRSIATGPAHM